MSDRLKPGQYWYYLIDFRIGVVTARIDSPQRLGIKYRAQVKEPANLIMRKSKLKIQEGSNYLPLFQELSPSEALLTGIPIDEWANQVEYKNGV